MKLGTLLNESQILIGFTARDKWESIEKMIDLLIAQGRLSDKQRKAVSDALVAREKIASTGMEHGVALPHASVDGIDDAMAVFGLSAEGVPFKSADGAPARLILLLISPRSGVQMHIRTLAGIARLMNYEEMRESLLRARTPQEALRIICDEENKVG